MYILKNALKNVSRNKGRNALLAAIIFAIIATTVVSLIINNTAAAVIENYKERFASEVSITADMQKVMQEAQKQQSSGNVLAVRQPQIPAEQKLAFAESEYLKESRAYVRVSANSESVRAIDQDDSANNNPGGGNAMYGPSGGGIMMPSLGSMGNFTLYGDYWKDFEDGSRSLDNDGRSKMPEADSECLISKELAEENNLKVGDTLVFSAMLSLDLPSDYGLGGKGDGDNITINGTEYTLESRRDNSFGARREAAYELKVVGIYLDLTEAYPAENIKNAGLNRRNEVLNTLNTLLNARKTDENGVMVEVTYYLKNPEMLEAFEAELRGKGLSELFNVTTDTSSYNKVVAPVVSLKSITRTFTIVVLALGAVILMLLAFISIRERKYEIGVLRAMGMKRGKVALGLWTEILAITCVCLIVGIGIGVAVAQPVSNKLLDVQVQALEKADEETPGMPGLPGSGPITIGGGRIMGGLNTNAQPLSEMKITVGLNTILEIIAIALLLASAAGLIAVQQITKYEPIKILMERN